MISSQSVASVCVDTDYCNKKYILFKKGDFTMKKTLALMLMMVLIAVFTLCGCGNDKDNGTNATEDTITLVGQWEYAEGGYVYTFNEDGTGSYLFGGTEMKFTYEDKGDCFSLLYDGNTTATDYDYSIEGEVLTMTDSFGSPVEYTRK